MGRYPEFDRSQLRLQPLAERRHDVTMADVLPLDAETPAFAHESLGAVADAMRAARAAGRPLIFSMGAHVIKQGLSRFVLDLIDRGYITCVATNGACVIHDYELARIGATSESVAKYIRDGRFGLWRETGEINEITRLAAAHGEGLGEAVGRTVAESDFPHRDVSIFAAAWRRGVPATVHVGVGYDIVHEHPNCDGAALGAASYRDFLIYTRVVEQLEDGVMLNFGSAVMGPEVYLKALSMARNVARRRGEQICHFTTAVFDLAPLPEAHAAEPAKTEALYYFRPWKTILVRTVADGGHSFYIRGDHRATLPALWRLLTPEGQPGV